MNQDFIDFLEDYACKESFSLVNPAIIKNEITSGILSCKKASNNYNVRDSIPRFVSSKSYAESFGREWQFFSKTQLDSYTGTTISSDRWTSITGYKPEDMTDKVVLEVGCGAGRFLEIVAPYAKKLIGLDITTAVDIAYYNIHDRYPRVDFLQADLYEIPLKANSIDFIYSIGVLHHIPNTLKGIKALIPLIKPGGSIAIWVYCPRFPLRILTHDIIRYFGCRCNPEKVLWFTKKYVPFALKSHRIPIVGKLFKYFLLWAADYPNLPIPNHLRLDWAILDTFDTFATKIEKNFHEEEVINMFNDAGLTNVRRGQVYNAIIGQKPE